MKPLTKKRLIISVFLLASIVVFAWSISSQTPDTLLISVILTGVAAAIGVSWWPPVSKSITCTRTLYTVDRSDLQQTTQPHEEINIIISQKDHEADGEKITVYQVARFKPQATTSRTISFAEYERLLAKHHSDPYVVEIDDNTRIEVEFSFQAHPKTGWGGPREVCPYEYERLNVPELPPTEEE